MKKLSRFSLFSRKKNKSGQSSPDSSPVRTPSTGNFGKGKGMGTGDDSPGLFRPHPEAMGNFDKNYSMFENHVSYK